MSVHHCFLCDTRFASDEELDAHVCDPARIPTPGNPISAPMLSASGAIVLQDGNDVYDVVIDTSQPNNLKATKRP